MSSGARKIEKQEHWANPSSVPRHKPRALHFISHKKKGTTLYHNHRTLFSEPKKIEKKERNTYATGKQPETIRSLNMREDRRTQVHDVST